MPAERIRRGSKKSDEQQGTCSSAASSSCKVKSASIQGGAKSGTRKPHASEMPASTPRSTQAALILRKKCAAFVPDCVSGKVFCTKHFNLYSREARTLDNAMGNWRWNIMFSCTSLPALSLSATISSQRPASSVTMRNSKAVRISKCTASIVGTTTEALMIIKVDRNQSTPCCGLESAQKYSGPDSVASSS